jgi:hypothetical protein
MTTAEISFNLRPTMSAQSYRDISPSELRSQTSTEIFEKLCSELCSQLFSDTHSFDSTLDEDSTSLPTSSDDPLRYGQWQEWAARARAEKRHQPTTDLLDEDEDEDVHVHVEKFMQLSPQQDASRSRKRSK